MPKLLQYASNLRADLCWKTAWSKLTPGAAPTLALLGNSGSAATEAQLENTYQFLQRSSTHWDTTLMVLGPQELASTLETKALFYDQIDLIKSLAPPGTILMNQTEFSNSAKNIVFLGASGWAPCKGSTSSLPPHAKTIFQVGPRLVSTDTLHSWAIEDMIWLHKRVKWWHLTHPTTRVILLTHNLSTVALLNKGLPYDGTSLAPAIEAEILMRYPNVYAWLCGATDSSCSGYAGGIFTSVNSATAKHYAPDRVLGLTLK